MKNKILLIMIILLFILSISGCNESFSEDKEKNKLDVVVSILPQKAFVNAVGGDLINTKVLIPPGGSPATYEPKPSELVSIERADIYFRVGHIPFEKSHLKKINELNPDIKIIDTSADVKLRYFTSHESNEDHEDEHSEDHEEGHIHEGVDPHVWLSPLQVKTQVDIIAQTLSLEDPDNAEVYNNNAKEYKRKLEILHSEIEDQFLELKTKKIMVFHPAWGYFADEYGLEQISIEESGKEPTAQELQHIIEEARKEEVKVIFVQSQFNKGIAESIAKEIGIVVITIDPLSEDYISNLRNIAKTIARSIDK